LRAFAQPRTQGDGNAGASLRHVAQGQQPGKLADIAVVDLDRVHLQPLNRTIATLVYAARGSDVVMTIVGGEIIYENGTSTKVDDAEVIAEARARSKDLIERAGLENLLKPWQHPPS